MGVFNWPSIGLLLEPIAVDVLQQVELLPLQFGRQLGVRQVGHLLAARQSPACRPVPWPPALGRPRLIPRDRQGIPPGSAFRFSLRAGSATALRGLCSRPHFLPRLLGRTELS